MESITNSTPRKPIAEASVSNKRRPTLVQVLGVGLVVVVSVALLFVGLFSQQKDRNADLRAQLEEGSSLNTSLAEELADAKRQRDDARSRAASLESRAKTVDARAAALDQREKDVAAREEAVTATEQRVAATSIGNGIWTVGVDVEPGTYRVAKALSGYCYWGIYRSGSNGDDIIENDGPEGGFPTVTLSEGQDFVNNGCGTFVKQ